MLELWNMKKLLVIVVLSLLWQVNAHAFRSVIGKGEIKLSEKVVSYFIKYLELKESVTFIVSKNGKYANYSTCYSLAWSERGCTGGSGATFSMIKRCKKDTKDECYIFAKRKKNKKIIRWNEVGYEFDVQQKDRDYIIKVLKDLNFY